MAVNLERKLQTKLNEICSSVQQEERRLKAERQAIHADRAAMAAELNSERAQLEEERANFEAEKEMITAAKKALKSKVKLDVGGMTYHASRTTLTSMPGSLLEAMFSGRHELEEDEDGRVFIDRDGVTFKLVLEYLRSPTLFSLDGLSQREVASCKAEFDYYCLPLPVLPTPPLCLCMNTDPDGWVRALLQGDKCTINNTPDDYGRCGWGWAAGVLCDHAAWKLHVQQVPICGGLTMGVIANPQRSSGCACEDASFAGWSVNPNNFFAHGGVQGAPGWPGWRDNDEAIFKLNAPARRLTVHLKRTGQCYTFPDLPAGNDGQWRFCIDMYYPTTVVLSRPTSNEHALVQ